MWTSNVSDLPGSPASGGFQASQPDPAPHNSLVDIIRENAAGPKRASGDAGSVEQHALSEQIAADKYLASKQAAKHPAQAFTRVRIISPGTV